MLKLKSSKQYKSDFKKLSDRDKKLVIEVVEKLQNQETLDAKYDDHPLKGKFKKKNIRDCHIRSNLVLLYSIKRDVLELRLLRVGNHSTLNLTSSYHKDLKEIKYHN